MSYAFRFYGCEPSDWFEGANDGHHYEVAFAKPPTATQLERLATAFETAFATGPARAARAPWLWSGRVARFSLGERWSRGTRGMFRQVASFLTSLHGMCPIEDVLFWGRREAGTGAWDQWSEAQRPGPIPGPPYPEGGARRPVDPSLLEAAPLDEFEALREAARRAILAQRIASSNAKSGVELAAAAILDRTPRQQALHTAAALRVGQPEPPRDADHRRRNGYHLRTIEPHIIAGRYDDNSLQGLFLFGGDGRPRAIETPEPVNFSTSLALHEGGRAGIVGVGKDVVALDVETMATKVAWSAETSVHGVGYFGDLWVVLTRVGLFVLDMACERAKVVAQAKAKLPGGSTGRQLIVVRRGTVAVVIEKGRFLVYGWASGKLKKLVVFKHPTAWKAEESDGRLLVSDGREAWEVRGIDELYEAWAGALAAEAARATTARHTRAKLTLESRASMPVVSMDSVDRRLRDRFPEEAHFVSAGGTSVGHACVRWEELGGSQRPVSVLAFARSDGDVVVVDEVALAEAGLSTTLGKVTCTRDGSYGAIDAGKQMAIIHTPSGQLYRYKSPRHHQPQAFGVTDDGTLVVLHALPWAKKDKPHLETARLSGSTADGAWPQSDVLVIPRAQSIRVHGRVVAVLTSAATRLALFAVDPDGRLVKLGGFKERVTDAAFDADGRLFVSVPGGAFEVAGLAQVAQAKLDAARRRSAKNRKGGG